MENPEILTDSTAAARQHRAATTARSVMKKLPEVTLAFWIMKIAATTWARRPATCSPRP